MNGNLFIESLNGLKSFTDRFDLLRVSKGDILSNSDVESLCLADYKVLLCGQNYGPMARGYIPFQDSAQLSKEDISFLEESRINTLDEPLITGYYFDVLSNAQEKKTSKYVDRIIENYLKVLSNPKEYKETDLSWVLKSLIYNSKTYKHREKDVLDAIDKVLSSDFVLMLKFRLIVNAYSFAFIKAKQVEALVAKHHLIDCISESYNDNCHFFNLLLKCIPQNKNRIIREIYHRLAENEDIIIKQHQIDSTLVENLLNKSIYLENGGFYDEAEASYRQFLIAKIEGKGIETVTWSWEFPQQLFYPQIIAIQNSVFPLMTLALDDSLLPPENVDEQALMSEIKRLGIRTTFVDTNGNPHSGYGFYSSKIMNLQYHNQYDLITLSPILASLKKLIENGSFSGARLCGYLFSTWLGKSRLTVNRSLRESHESWLDVMRPSIYSICFEITSEIMSEGTYKGDYICSIDSLVTKIEGCIRDACRHLLINTVKEKSHDEIPLEQLFDKIEEHQKRKEKVISSASLKMLRGILTKQGKNLRNNVAHGFTSIADYSINNAITVLHCLSKVSAIDIPKDLFKIDSSDLNEKNIVHGGRF